MERVTPGLRSIKIIGKRKAKGRETRCFFDRLSMFCCLFPSLFKTFHHTKPPSSSSSRHTCWGSKHERKKKKKNLPSAHIIILFIMFHCSPNHPGRERRIAFISFIVAPIRVLQLFLIVRTAVAAARSRKGKRAAAARSLLLLYTWRCWWLWCLSTRSELEESRCRTRYLHTHTRPCNGGIWYRHRNFVTDWRRCVLHFSVFIHRSPYI